MRVRSNLRSLIRFAVVVPRDLVILVEKTVSLVINFARMINFSSFFALPAGVAADSAARPDLPFCV